jgi:hypothetical protein
VVNALIWPFHHQLVSSEDFPSELLNLKIKLLYEKQNIPSNGPWQSMKFMII